MPDHKYVSDELFHFVGFSHPSDHEANYQVLLKILDSKMVIYRDFDPGSIGLRMSVDWNADIVNGQLVVRQVTCYCDIPETALGIHKSKYGLFGVGFPRTYMVGRGTRPVIYVPIQPNDYRSGWGSIYGVLAIEDWKNAWDAFNEFVVEPNREHVMKRTLNIRPQNAKEAVWAVDDLVTKDFFAFIKAFDCDLSDDEVSNYYMEREWRLIGALRFSESDLSSVFVPKHYEKRLIDDRPSYQSLLRVSDNC